jgi:hypothetical protein
MVCEEEFKGVGALEVCAQLLSIAGDLKSSQNDLREQAPSATEGSLVSSSSATRRGPISHVQ